MNSRKKQSYPLHGKIFFPSLKIIEKVPYDNANEEERNDKLIRWISFGDLERSICINEINKDELPKAISKNEVINIIDDFVIKIMEIYEAIVIVAEINIVTVEPNLSIKIPDGNVKNMIIIPLESIKVAVVDEISNAWIIEWFRAGNNWTEPVVNEVNEKNNITNIHFHIDFDLSSNIKNEIICYFHKNNI